MWLYKVSLLYRQIFASLANGKYDTERDGKTSIFSEQSAFFVSHLERLIIRESVKQFVAIKLYSCDKLLQEFTASSSKTRRC